MSNSIEINEYKGKKDKLSLKLVRDCRDCLVYELKLNLSANIEESKILIPISNKDKTEVLSLINNVLKDDTRYVIVNENRYGINNNQNELKCYKSYFEAKDMALI
jgi:hypothetical protein